MLENKKKIAVLLLRMFCESAPGAIMSQTCFHTAVCSFALSHMVALLVSAVMLRGFVSSDGRGSWWMHVSGAAQWDSVIQWCVSSRKLAEQSVKPDRKSLLSVLFFLISVINVVKDKRSSTEHTSLHDITSSHIWQWSGLCSARALVIGRVCCRDSCDWPSLLQRVLWLAEWDPGILWLAKCTISIYTN